MTSTEPPPASLRIGRKHVHGRRVREVVAVQEASTLVARMDANQVAAAKSLLRRALSATSFHGPFIRPEEEEAAILLADGGVLRVEEKAEGTAAVYHWRPYRARLADDRMEEIRGLLGKIDPDAARRHLLDAGAGCPELADEIRLLEAVPTGKLRVPEGSRASTSDWNVYSAAFRAAVIWWSAEREGRRYSARELAAVSLGWSKAWTDAKETAFSQLIDRVFADAVDTMEPEVRLRGPLCWTERSTIVDAREARPWVAIPARNALRHGRLDHSGARGLLIIENLDTFEAICRHSPVTETWLCLWGHGYVNDSLVALVRDMDKPTVCWSDLDAHGVRIVTNLAHRASVRVWPVFMDARYLAEAPHLPQDADQVKLAMEMTKTGLPELRELAALVADLGLGREQETMYHLIPELSSLLDQHLGPDADADG